MLRPIDLADPAKLRTYHLANRDHPLAAQRLGDELPPARVAREYRGPLPAGKARLTYSATDAGSVRPRDPAQQRSAGGQLNCLVVRRLEA